MLRFFEEKSKNLDNIKEICPLLDKFQDICSKVHPIINNLKADELISYEVESIDFVSNFGLLLNGHIKDVSVLHNSLNILENILKSYNSRMGVKPEYYCGATI